MQHYFNRPMKMNSGDARNQLDDRSWEFEPRGFPEFEILAMHPNCQRSTDEERKLQDFKLTRCQSSFFNKLSSDIPVSGETSLSPILKSKDNTLVNKHPVKQISSKQSGDNLHNQRRVRPRVDQLKGLTREAVTSIRQENSRAIRPTSGKDRHSKVNTSKGPRDRRVRLSVPTAVQFYDVQDRLGYDQPSKAVEWLMKNAKAAIDDLWQQPFAASTSESLSKKSLTGSPLRQFSHYQVSSTSEDLSNTLNQAAAPSSLYSISEFEREYRQINAIQESCGAQPRNQVNDSKTVIPGSSIGENDEQTTEHLNAHIHAQKKSESDAQKPAEEDVSREKYETDNTSSSASFGGYQFHQCPPALNASSCFHNIRTRDIQPSDLVNYVSTAQEPAHPWYGVMDETHYQERLEAGNLGTLSQSQMVKLIQAADLQYFSCSCLKSHQSEAANITQNSLYKAVSKSKIPRFEDTTSASCLSDSNITSCSCITACTRGLSSYGNDIKSMLKTPSTSQFCPVTNSSARTPTMHFVSDSPFKRDMANTLQPSNPSLLSNGTCFSLKQSLDTEGPIHLQTGSFMQRFPWLSATNQLDPHTVLCLPSSIDTTTSIFPTYSANNAVPEDVDTLPSSSKKLHSFNHIGCSVLPSSQSTCSSPLIRPRIPARNIQGFDELKRKALVKKSADIL